MPTQIEWVRNEDGGRGETWNPIRGCTIVSKGCENCYAMGIAARFSASGRPFEGVAKMVHGKPHWTGKIKLVPEKLAEPLRWKKPRTVFVNSMSDLFHEGVPDDFIDRVFAVMGLTPQHTYQILSKRPARMARYMTAEWVNQRVYNAALKLALESTKFDNLSDVEIRPVWPLPNVWLGVSVEDQATADERIPHLLNTPAAVRFVSYEPALGPVNFTGHLPVCWSCGTPYNGKGPEYPCHVCGLNDTHGHFVDWIIYGGESGPGARPSHPDWARGVRDQCAAADVAFFMKQGSKANWPDYKNFESFPDDLKIREFPNAIA